MGMAAIQGSYAFVFEPLSRMSFKPPTPFTAGIHGPGAAGTSLSYPMPSTLAGRIANLAFTAGLCDNNNGSIEDYSDVTGCLEQLLGRGFHLRTGLLVDGEGRVYAYINGSSMPSVETLHSSLESSVAPGEPLSARTIVEALRGAADKGPKITAVRAAYTGIALASGKRVRENLIYSLEYVQYRPHASILVEATAPNTNSVLDQILGRELLLKLGSKTGIFALRKEKIQPRRLYGDPTSAERAVVLLTSPALLDQEHNPYMAGEPVLVSSPETARRLAEKLLEAAGHLKKDDAVRARVVLVPKGEYSHSVETLGWSFRENRPRPPMLVVPPGTVLVIERPERELLEDIAAKGLGLHSRLGWGSSLVFAL